MSAINDASGIRPSPEQKAGFFRKEAGCLKKIRLSFSEKKLGFPPKKVGSFKKSWVLTKMSGFWEAKLGISVEKKLGF